MSKSSETASGGETFVLTQYDVIPETGSFGVLWECFLTGDIGDFIKLPLEPGQALRKVGCGCVRIFTVKPNSVEHLFVCPRMTAFTPYAALPGPRTPSY